MVRTVAIILASFALMSGIAQAETIRLTPEQAEAAIESGAARKARSQDLSADGSLADRGVHGEVGVAVGTGGYRSMYGVVGVPLGDTGGMVLGYNQERGRGYGPLRGNQCRGISADLCDWRLGTALVETNR